MTLSAITNYSKFFVAGRKITVDLFFSATPGGTLNNTIYVTMPVNRAATVSYRAEQRILLKDGANYVEDVLMRWYSTSATRIDLIRIGSNYSAIDHAWYAKFE